MGRQAVAHAHTCERDIALASSTSALWLRGHVPESTRRMSSSTVVIVSSELGPVGSGRLRFRGMMNWRVLRSAGPRRRAARCALHLAPTLHSDGTSEFAEDFFSRILRRR